MDVFRRPGGAMIDYLFVAEKLASENRVKGMSFNTFFQYFKKYRVQRRLRGLCLYEIF